MESGLAAIKLIKLAGQPLNKLTRIFTGFFRLFFKLFFYEALIKIYYRLFRLKKNELAGMPLKNFVQRELAGSLIFIFTILLFFSNFLGGNSDIKTASAKLSKTTASALISSNFDTSIEETLIEEYLTPATINDARQKNYFADLAAAYKQEAPLNEDNSIDSGLDFSDSNDLVFKPQIISDNLSSDNAAPKRSETINYTVQIGDTVSSIANHFGLSVNTILWANNLGAYSLIRPGDSLIILPYSGLLYTVKSGDTISKIARTYSIEEDQIISQNNLNASGGLKIGQNIILPGAKKLTVKNIASNSYTGISLIKDIVTKNVTKAPAAKSANGKMVWPTSGYRLTQYFSWRHNGVDIANKVGTPIYAADAGTVEISRGGYNGGYGNTIVINHGGGIKTRYGHMSKLFVAVGDKVAKGENIGAMGSTGRSTGSHLHFEVLVNGTRYNPLSYVK